VEHEKQRTTMVDSYGILWAWLWLNVAMIFGYILDEALRRAGSNCPCSCPA